MVGHGMVLVLLALVFSGGLAGPLSTMEEDLSSNFEDTLTDYNNNDNIFQDTWYEEDDSTQQQQREKRYLALNDYLIQVYLNTQRLKDSNCTEKLFNQTVSPHFCNSNKVVYSLLKVERVDGILFENYSYELCSNVSRLTNNDTVLGHDFVIYKHPPEEKEEDNDLEIFLIIQYSPIYMELVSHRIIPANTSGWQVFHIESDTRPIINQSVCITMYIRQLYTDNETVYHRFLNQTEIAEVFILNDTDPSQSINQAFVSTFVIFSGTITLPLGRKRSIETSDGDDDINSTQCTLRNHSVNLDHYLSEKVIYPPQMNIGSCGGSTNTYHHHNQEQRQDNINDREEEEEEEEEEEDGPGTTLEWGDENYSDVLYQCVPTMFDDTPVLIDLDDDIIALLRIPNLIITGCELQAHNT